jgi:hypothetical protein
MVAKVRESLAVGKQTPLGRPRRRWVDNIRMDLGEVGWGDVDWTGQAQDRNRWRALVNSVLSLRIPYNAGKLLSSLTINGLSSSAQLHRVRVRAITFMWLYRTSYKSSHHQ